MNLCEYGKILGEPNIKLHKHFFGFAIFDLIGTMIISFVIAYFIKKYIKKPSFSLIFSIILLIFVSIGEYLHGVFCIYGK
jgi:predicted membrane protein